MSTSFKKLLLIFVATLLVMVSGGAMAQTTYYDFSSNGPIAGFSNVYGTFSVNSTTGALISGTLYEGGTGMTGGTADPNGGAVGWQQNSLHGAGFIASVPSSYIYIRPSGPVSIYLLADPSFYGYSSNIVSFEPGVSAPYQAPNGAITLSGGAPEIDGALAPKVGFLLACLFLMFGRKKKTVEPMLTV